MQKMAWHAANIMNMLRSSKTRPIRPSDLLGNRKTELPPATREEFREEMRSRKRRTALRSDNV